MVNVNLNVNIGGKRCMKCGEPLYAGWRACQKCGEPVMGQASGVQASPADDETVIGVIANVTLARGLGRKSYNLVVTTQRIIGAEITAKMIAEEANRVDQECKARGDNMLVRMSKRTMAGLNLFERYYTMPPAAILAENKDNSALAVRDISACKVVSSDEGYPTQVTLQSTQGKTNYTLDPNAMGSGKVRTEDAVGILRQAGIKVN